MTKLENCCANCGGKFGLVYHRHWGLRFCRKACKDDFLSKTAKDRARMRKWFGWVASSKERNPPISRQPAQAETDAYSSYNDTTSPTSARKLISYTSVTIGDALLVLAERALRSSDKLDYLIRRWVISDHPSSAISYDSAFPIVLTRKIAVGTNLISTSQEENISYNHQRAVLARYKLRE